MLSRDWQTMPFYMCVCVETAYVHTNKQNLYTCDEKRTKNVFRHFVGVMENAMFAWIQTIIYKLIDILSHATIYYVYLVQSVGVFRSLFNSLFLLHNSPFSFYFDDTHFLSSVLCVHFSHCLTYTHTHPSTDAWLSNDKCHFNTLLYCLIHFDIATGCVNPFHNPLWYGLMWCVFGMMCPLLTYCPWKKGKHSISTDWQIYKNVFFFLRNGCC